MANPKIDLKSVANMSYSDLLGLRTSAGGAGSGDTSQDMQQSALQDATGSPRFAVDDGTPPQAQLVSGGQQNRGLAPYAQSILDRYDNAPLDPNDTTLAQEKQRFRPKLVAILSQYGTMDQIRKAPQNIRATLYGLTQLGDRAYGKEGTVTDPDLGTVPSGAWKCNILASKCWARGAGIGYNTNGNNTGGYPTYSGGLPPTANDIYTKAYNMSNFTHTPIPHTGDIFAYQGNPGEDGHSGLYLGGNLAVYAGPDDVKLGSLPYIKQQEEYSVSPRFRTYTPGN